MFKNIFFHILILHKTTNIYFKYLKILKKTKLSISKNIGFLKQLW